MTGYCKLCQLRLEAVAPVVDTFGTSRAQLDAMQLGMDALNHLRLRHSKDFQAVVQGLGSLQAFVGLALLDAPPALAAAGQAAPRPDLEVQRAQLRAQLLEWLSAEELFTVRRVVPAPGASS